MHTACIIIIIHVCILYVWGGMCALMRSLPLAPKPLTTPHCYDSSFVVPVHLDAPLWGEALGSRQLTTEMLALCLQLDATVLSCQKHTEEGGGRERKVTFQHRLPVRVAAVLDQMSELLSSGAGEADLESYLRESGLALLFPRVELCLQEPDQDLVRVDTGLLDGYLTRLSQLNSVRTLAQQLSSDVQSSSSHKYIAHQTALLYQCIGQTTAFPNIRKDIEKTFNVLKSGCSAEAGSIPRLSPDLQSWIVRVCHLLQSEESCATLLSSMHHITNMFH